MVIIEGLVVCFIVLMACVVGISNGAVNLVFLYEKEVQDKVVEIELITREKIKRNKMLFMLFGMLPCWIFMICSVYWINGARGFWEGFWQIYVIMMIEGLFDRLFIDFFWVGKTKAWIIPGTESLMPYIYGKTLASKWIGTIIGSPICAAALSGIMMIFIRG